jgi:hypothetical protein
VLTGLWVAVIIVIFAAMRKIKTTTTTIQYNTV